MASIFLNNVTMIDHSYIDECGRIIGSTVSPKIVVSGKVDNQEGVVADFSEVKKEIKATIDHNSYGMDHKLILIKKYSKYLAERDRFNNWIITTPHIKLWVPQDAVIEVSGYSYSIMAEWIRDLLSKRLTGFDFQVKCEQPVITYHNTPYFRFAYSHGLRHSSSYGCQNIAHGHTSFVTSNDTNRNVPDVLRAVSHTLNNAVIVNEENIKESGHSGMVVSYETERGYFRAEYDDSHKIIVLPHEPTIENIVSFIWGGLNRSGHSIGDLYISEGLEKGGYITK